MASAWSVENKTYTTYSKWSSQREQFGNVEKKTDMCGTAH
jgi:hypothetical protein